MRVRPAVYEPMRPEWTVTNPPYVNCLALHTTEPPLALAAVSGWRGPEGLLVLTARGPLQRGSQCRLPRGARGRVQAPPRMTGAGGWAMKIGAG